MSQHRSLRSKSKGSAHRSVLKRHERIKELKDKEKWDEEKSIFGLPKLKIIKFKIKKEKPVEAEAAAEGAETAVASKTEGAKPEAQQGAKKEASKPEAKGKSEAKGKPEAKGKEKK